MAQDSNLLPDHWTSVTAGCQCARLLLLQLQQLLLLMPLPLLLLPPPLLLLLQVLLRLLSRCCYINLAAAE